MCLLLVRRMPLPHGRSSEARLYFEKMLGYANHLGLYGEEPGPASATSRQLPPRPSRTLALISAAYDLDPAPLSTAGYAA